MFVYILMEHGGWKNKFEKVKKITQLFLDPEESLKKKKTQVNADASHKLTALTFIY